jgi:hypothetical protein
MSRETREQAHIDRVAKSKRDAAATNAKYAARDVLIPEIGYIAIGRALAEDRAELTQLALDTTPWTRRLTPAERAMIEIVSVDMKGAEGFEVTLGDGSVWTINVSASRLR